MKKIYITKEELENLYINKYMDCREIAKIYGVCAATIHTYLKDYSIPLRKKAPRYFKINIEALLKNTSSPKKQRPPKDVLIDLYVNQHKSMPQIARLLNYSRSLIYKAFKEYKIEVRKNVGGLYYYKNDKAKMKLIGEKTRKKLKAKYKSGELRAWNQDLTVETDDRVKAHEEKRRKNRVYTTGPQGWKHTEEAKKKQSLAHGGTGIPYENSEYGADFDNALKEQIRFRDKYTCQMCGCSQIENGRQLDIHHIDYNKKHSEPNNLISLCRECHKTTNYNRIYWTSYFIDKIKRIVATFIKNKDAQNTLD